MTYLITFLILYLIGFVAFLLFTKQAFKKVYDKQKFPVLAAAFVSLFWPVLAVYYVYVYIVYRRPRS